MPHQTLCQVAETQLRELLQVEGRHRYWLQVVENYVVVVVAAAAAAAAVVVVVVVVVVAAAADTTAVVGTAGTAVAVTVVDSLRVQVVAVACHRW